jgi:hypothetical protein
MNFFGELQAHCKQIPLSKTHVFSPRLNIRVNRPERWTQRRAAAGHWALAIAGAVSNLKLRIPALI